MFHSSMEEFHKELVQTDSTTKKRTFEKSTVTKVKAWSPRTRNKERSFWSKANAILAMI